MCGPKADSSFYSIGPTVRLRPSSARARPTLIKNEPFGLRNPPPVGPIGVGDRHDTGRSNIARHARMPSPNLMCTGSRVTNDPLHQRLLSFCLLYSYSVCFTMESLENWRYDKGERIGVHLPCTDTNHLIQTSTGPGQTRTGEGGKQ